MSCFVVSQREHNAGAEMRAYYSNNDRMPVHSFPVARRGPHAQDEHGESEETDCAVLTGIVCALLACKSADHDDGYGKSGTREQPEAIRNEGQRDAGQCCSKPNASALTQQRSVRAGTVVEE